MSKEFQDEAKRLGLTGNQLMQKYREEGKIVSTTKSDDKQKNQKLKLQKFLHNDNNN